MDYQKLLSQWSMKTPQVVGLGTESMYYLEGFAKYLDAQQGAQADAPRRCSCGDPATINGAWCEACFPGAALAQKGNTWILKV